MMQTGIAENLQGRLEQSHRIAYRKLVYSLTPIVAEEFGEKLEVTQSWLALELVHYRIQRTVHARAKAELRTMIERGDLPPYRFHLL